MVGFFVVVALGFIVLGFATLNAPDLTRLGFWLLGIGVIAGVVAGAMVILGVP